MRYVILRKRTYTPEVIDMKRIGRNILLLLFCLMLSAVLLPARTHAADGDVAINETTFPDANFRSYVSENFDADKNGVLSQSERKNVTSINVKEKNISKLDGVEYFPNLKTLDCSKNQLTSLDVSKNTALTQLKCYVNQLTTLDVSKNTALTLLNCCNNNLASLELPKSTALSELQCYNNQLITLDVSKNTGLGYLVCSINKLTSLDVSMNTKLGHLSCESNKLTSLDVSSNIKLRKLYCYDNLIEELRIRNCPDLINTVAAGSKMTYDDFIYYFDNSNELRISPSTRLITLDIEPPVITTQSETVYTTAGKPVILSLTVATPRGTTLTYQWYRNGEAVSGATKATYLFIADDSMSGDQYYCDVSNAGGSVRTKTIEIRIVTAPKITTQPKAVSVKAGKTATFKIKAGGEGLKYQWYYQKPGTTKWVKITKNGAKPTYKVTAKKSMNGWKYKCLVSNAAGKVYTKAVKLTVK